MYVVKLIPVFYLSLFHPFLKAYVGFCNPRPIEEDNRSLDPGSRLFVKPPGT